MSSRHHIDDFMRGRIIGKIEEGRKITDVARVFDIAHSVVSLLWKSFKTTGMCSRRHGGGRVTSTTPAEDRYIVLSAKRNRRTTAQQVANQFLAASGKQISRKTLAVQDCLDSEGIQRLVWPARSPDLNHIENVWEALGRQVAGRNYPPTNKNTLIHALTEEWDKLPQQLLDNVVQKGLVIFSDSKAAIGATRNGETNISCDIITLLGQLHSRRKSCILQWIPAHVNIEVTEFDCPRIITSTIARLRTEHLKGMKIHPDKTRSYVQCKHCPDLQLTPNHILECPIVAIELLKMGMVPLRDSLREILYSPDAPRIAEAVMKTSTEFSDIYCIYSWTREQQ
ncbi:RNase H domain-containing protein [Trichonephila clavipes]|nr:RNase H domain-containing protein [Trichonephila clavipes]